MTTTMTTVILAISAFAFSFGVAAMIGGILASAKAKAFERQRDAILTLYLSEGEQTPEALKGRAKRARTAIGIKEPLEDFIFGSDDGVNNVVPFVDFEKEWKP